MHPSQASRVALEPDYEEESSDFIRLTKGPVKCVCPRCGMTHVLNFFWSGKGTPRKYCHRCRETVVSVNSEYVYESVYESDRRHRSAMSAATD